MPWGKQFDAAEKSKILAWYFKKVPAKEIARSLNRDLSAVHRIVWLNKNLPMAATTPPSKKRSCHPSQHIKVSRSRKRGCTGMYVLCHPFKTAKQLKMVPPRSEPFRTYATRGLDCCPDVLKKSLFWPTRWWKRGSPSVKSSDPGW